jgi:leucyl-tRNA synthetase
MTKEGAGLRTGPKNSYHDKVFEEEINNLINITNEQYHLYAASLCIYPYPY